MEYGAVIERGQIIAVSGSKYTIASLDRDGIETPPMETVQEINADNEPLSVGTKVYFFMFNDGTGKVLCPI